MRWPAISRSQHDEPGWMVRPLDFALFDQLYDTRIVLELAAVRWLCEHEHAGALAPLSDTWLVPAALRLSDERAVAALDEQFHERLMVATGNLVMAQMHREVTERIRIIRQLDFTDAGRMAATYDEHAQLLGSILRRKGDHACLLLKSHIETSKRAVREITLHRLFMARHAAPVGSLTSLPLKPAIMAGTGPGAGGHVAGRAGRVSSPRLAGQTV